MFIFMTILTSMSTNVIPAPCTVYPLHLRNIATRCVSFQPVLSLNNDGGGADAEDLDYSGFQ